MIIIVVRIFFTTDDSGGIVGVDLIANVCLVCAVNKDYSGRSGGPRSIPSYIVLNVLGINFFLFFIQGERVASFHRVMISGILTLNAGG